MCLRRRCKRFERILELSSFICSFFLVRVCFVWFSWLLHPTKASWGPNEVLCDEKKNLSGMGGEELYLFRWTKLRTTIALFDNAIFIAPSISNSEKKVLKSTTMMNAIWVFFVQFGYPKRPFRAHHLSLFIWPWKHLCCKVYARFAGDIKPKNFLRTVIMKLWIS